MRRLRLDLRIPAFGGGGSSKPPPPPAVPTPPVAPDTSKLTNLQRRTGNARGLAGTIRTAPQGTGDTSTSSVGSLVRALKALTGN